jgi:hypothetical protein
LHLRAFDIAHARYPLLALFRLPLRIPALNHFACLVLQLA